MQSFLVAQPNKFFVFWLSQQNYISNPVFVLIAKIYITLQYIILYDKILITSLYLQPVISDKFTFPLWI